MNNFLPSANTAPVLSSISNITVNAGDTIVIAANASDLEGDTLSYNIDSSFFDKTGNIFTWQTSLYSAGNYSFRVTVNDGNLGDSQLVFVKVIGLKYNCTMPMDNMLITNNTLFCPGTYTILNSINVNKAGVLINCNGTILKGNGSGTGFSLQTGNITITNCNFEKLGNGILSQYNHRFGYFIGNNFLNCGYGIYILES